MQVVKDLSVNKYFRSLLSIFIKHSLAKFRKRIVILKLIPTSLNNDELKYNKMTLNLLLSQDCLFVCFLFYIVLVKPRLGV